MSIVDIRGDKVRLGITAERSIPVHRGTVVKAHHQDDEVIARMYELQQQIRAVSRCIRD